VKSDTDWRKNVAGNARVILIGDAVHPMTPGRGQDANQALTNAGNLVDLLQKPDLTARNFSIEKLSGYT
jgi:2-polyprenyl-6-methoxyphenol hydroxylase-like FAD-dependent oxidoreductase